MVDTAPPTRRVPEGPAIQPQEGPASPRTGLAGRRIEGLDGIRGLATALVVAHHLTARFFPQPGYVPKMPSWAIAGFLGVDLFFVLSGFLVATLGFEHRTRDGSRWWVTFYQRRAVRLLPALVVFLAAHAIYSEVVGLSTKVEVWSLLLALTGLTNLAPVLGSLGLNEGLLHLWTLAIEWQFYVVLPLLVLVLQPRRTKSSLAILAGLIIAVAAWRTHLFLSGVAMPWLYLRTDTRIDSILVGVALAYATPLWRGFPRLSISVAGWLGLGVYLFIVLRSSETDPFLYRMGFTVVAVLCAAVVASVVREAGPFRLLKIRPLRAIGRVSYGLYIWHVLVIEGVARWGSGWSQPVQVTVSLTVTTAVTLASWNWVEKPVSAWFSRRSRAAAVAPIGA